MENKDEELTERQALKQAAKQGITFIDEFLVEGDPGQTIYDNHKDAEKAADGRNVIQRRYQDRSQSN